MIEESVLEAAMSACFEDTFIRGYRLGNLIFERWRDDYKPSFIISEPYYIRWSRCPIRSRLVSR